jgi:hypothetical protein
MWPQLFMSTFACLQSTMFNALCENGKAEAANYPFCTIEPNVGIVAVPDDRMEVGHDSFSSTRCGLPSLEGTGDDSRNFSIPLFPPF